MCLAFLVSPISLFFSDQLQLELGQAIPFRLERSGLLSACHELSGREALGPATTGDAHFIPAWIVTPEAAQVALSTAGLA